MTNDENKFPKEYTDTINGIKRRLKKNPDVSKNQIKKYNSKALAPSGAFLMTHIDMIHQLKRDNERLKKLLKEERKETERLGYALKTPRS